MNTMVITHGGYLAIGLAATVWVIWTLRRRGVPFLVEGCRGDTLLAETWSHLLTVGLCLLHVGCLLLALRFGGVATTPTEAIELLSTKIGLVLLALAFTHLLHVKLYWRMYEAGKSVPLAATIVSRGHENLAK
jgi:hypothetical protein